MRVFRYFAAVLLLTFSVVGHATLLKYEMTFVASNPENSISGTGYLFADTEKDSVVGGRFESDRLAFEWLDPDAAPLMFEERYYTADLVTGPSGFSVTNEVTGEIGSIDFMQFLIVGPEGRAPYAAHLNDHWAGEFPTVLGFPGFEWDAGGYSESFLLTEMYIDAPTEVETATHAVPEPATLSLLFLGLAAIGIRRRLVSRTPH